MILLQLPSEPAASERERFEKKGVSDFLVAGKIEGRMVSPPLFNLSRFDEALEAALSSGDGVETLLRLRPFLIDEYIDRIVNERMRAAQTDSIRASNRVLLGRVGVSLARLMLRRLQTALNSSRFALLKENGAKPPRLLIDLAETAPSGIEVARRYAAECAHPDAAFLLSPRQLPMFEGWEPTGPGLGDGFADAKFMVDKLANYQIDLNRVAEDLERIA